MHPDDFTPRALGYLDEHAVWPGVDELYASVDALVQSWMNKNSRYAVDLLGAQVCNDFSAGLISGREILDRMDTAIRRRTGFQARTNPRARYEEGLYWEAFEWDLYLFKGQEVVAHMELVQRARSKTFEPERVVALPGYGPMLCDLMAHLMKYEADGDRIPSGRIGPSNDMTPAAQVMWHKNHVKGFWPVLTESQFEARYGVAPREFRKSLAQNGKAHSYLLNSAERLWYKLRESRAARIARGGSVD